MSLPLKIAWRYLVSKKGHQAVNIISIVAVCGVVVSTAALICVLAALITIIITIRTHIKMFG